jgi:ribose/xylose/arabinose/galactoside ABC-type transport system permease subunit
MKRAVPRWRRLLLSEYVVLGLSAAWFLALLPVVPGLSSPENLANIFSSALPLLVVAVGQTVVVITGGIDLSVTSVIALASTCGGLLMSADRQFGAGAPAGIAAMIAIGIAVGLLNGAAVSLLRMPPFIVTMAAMTFFGGYAVWLTKSMNVYHLPAGFVAIGNQVWTALLVAGGAAVAGHLMLRRSLLGRWLYAVGSNARTSRVSGVPVAWVIVAAYAVSGLCGSLASVLYTGRLETGSPVMGQRVLLDVIGAVVIGGTSLFGGKGKIAWTVYGVVFMALMDNSLNLMGLSNFGILIAKGLLILAAALLDAARNRYAAA